MHKYYSNIDGLVLRGIHYATGDLIPNKIIEDLVGKEDLIKLNYIKVVQPENHITNDKPSSNKKSKKSRKH